MSPYQKSDDDFLLCFSDLVRIIKKNRNKIFFFVGVFALLGAWHSLTKPLLYKAEATFKEKGKSQAGVPRSIGDMLLGGSVGTQESEAMTVMESARINQMLAYKMGLQAQIGKKETSLTVPFVPTLSRMWTNLNIQLAHVRNQDSPFVESTTPMFTCQAVEYAGEVPLGATVVFKTENTFDVYDSKENSLGEGKLGVPFEGKEFTFTLICNHSNPLNEKEYALTFLPLRHVVADLKNSIKIDVDKEDKTLLSLQYTHPDRAYAMLLLNELMATYQQYLREEHERNGDIQLAYLEKRKKETAQNQRLLMEGYAAEREHDLTHTGLLDTDKEMEFLMENQKRYHQKLFGIELVSKRLHNVLEQGNLSFDQALLENNSNALNVLFESLDSLKQHSITLSLALRENQKEQEEDKNKILEDQIVELNDIRRTILEVKTLIHSLKSDTPVEGDLHVLHDSKLLVSAWFNRLQDSIKANEHEEWKHQKSSYLSYLSHLQRLLEIQEKTLQERIAHQYSPKAEFQGISLDTANQLYREYTKEYQELEAEILQNIFTAKQLEDPNFEIFSLSSVLKDSVSQGIITRSGNLALLVRDQNNRTTKEMERTKSELELQKHFLKSHLEQMVKLQQLRETLVQEKIRSLQEITLELLHQKMSVIEQHIKDLVVSRLYSLEQEKILVENQLNQLNQQMAKLPKKWVSEQLIKNNLVFNKGALEELARLVEGKNITTNLELIQSAPLDAAFAPILPNSPRLLFFVLLGACFGAFVSCGYFVVKSTFAGVEASLDNLKASQQHVLGSISKECQGNMKEPLTDCDLATIRRIMAFSDETYAGKWDKTPRGQGLLLIEGYGSNYALVLARLMAKKGLKVLVLPLTFDQAGASQHLPGLLQYLEGQATAPKIISEGSFDQIASGGISRYAGELVCSDAFRKLFHQLAQSYDIILAVTHAQPCSAEAGMVFDLFDQVVVTLTDEKLLDLGAYTKWAFDPDSKKKISFVLAHED